MAERWAVSSGVWSDTARWDGGTLPGSGDDVYANGFNITLDMDITVLSLNSRAGTVPVAGGSFSGGIGRVINADIYAGTSSYCIYINLGAVINGNSYGSTTTTGTNAIQLDSYGTHNGNSYGGSVQGSVGTYAGQRAVHNGNSYGGTGKWSYGTLLDYTSYQNGNSYGGAGLEACGSFIGQSLQNGNAYGGSGVGAAGSYIYYGSFYGSVFGGEFESNDGAHGLLVSDYSLAFIDEATGYRESVFGVYSSTHSIIVIKNEIGSYAKSVLNQKPADHNLFSFLAFEKIPSVEPYGPFNQRVFRNK